MNIDFSSDESILHTLGILSLNVIRMNQSIESLHEKIDSFDTDKNVVVLWDVENVIPSVDSLFMDGFMDYIKQFGDITIAKAFADWTNPTVTKLCTPLSRNRFELIHTPSPRKNSSDIVLITHGMEIALKYPNMSTFILVTGDSDFRSLVLSLIKSGKKVHIICDVKTASEDLLSLASSFKDFRKLIPGGQEKAVDETELNLQQENIEEEITLQIAFDLLREVIGILEGENKIPEMGMVKVKLKMLNPTFNEKNLGFKKWSDFIDEAVKSNSITIEQKDSCILLRTKKTKSIEKESELSIAFSKLVNILKQLDKNNKPKYRQFPQIAEKLYEEINAAEIKKLGFKQFKDFVLAAESRNLVETKAKGLDHSMKRTTDA